MDINKFFDKIEQEENKMDLISIKIEPIDENVGNENQKILDTSDITLELKIEEDDFFAPDEEKPYSHFQSGSLYDVKIGTDEIIEPKVMSGEGKSLSSQEVSPKSQNQSLLEVASLIIGNEESNRKKNVKKSVVKNLKCMECGKSFQANGHLKDHIRIHTGEKPFKCQECGKCFTQQSNLTRHSIMHSGMKSFKCEECEKCFTRKDVLTAHRNTHQSVKLYECEECGKCFPYKYLLTSHLRIHTGESPFQCQKCGKCFTVRSSLNTHLKAHKKREDLFKIVQLNKHF